jgi:hypothetical protein
MQESLKHTGVLLQIDKNQFMKISLFVPKDTKVFEILVDYILFAKEKDMKNEASLFESIIDSLVYDLYFPDDMKKADCFISDEVVKLVKEFDETTTMIKKIYKIFNENKTIQRGLIYRRVIGVVKTINGLK